MTRSELSADEFAPPLPSKRAGAWAWGLCWLMFASTVLNYMDRQTMALVSGPIMKEFRLSAVDYGWVLSAFYLVYALLQVPAGYLVDRVNVRWAYAGAVAWWSLAGMALAFAPSLGVLMALRAVLGVGESFNWPCALRATATVLPPEDRSLGNGIFNSGAAVGAVVTPLVVTPLTAWYGWRTAFLLVGSLGFVWVAAWLMALGGDRRHLFAGRPTKPRADPLGELLSEPPGLPAHSLAVFVGILAAAALIALSAVRVGRPAVWWGITLAMVGPLLAALVLPMSALRGADWAEALGEVVRCRRFWVLVLVSVSINVCWHFLVNWLPTYLMADRGMSYLASGFWSAVPFLAADAGNLGGGALARQLAGRGVPAARARLAVMTLCTLIITCGAWVGLVRSDLLVIALLGLMALGTAAFMANYFAFTQEVAPHHTGLVVGILGGLGNLFAAGFMPFAGYVKVATRSYAPIFVLVGLLPFVGLAALHLGWRAGEVEPKPH